MKKPIFARAFTRQEQQAIHKALRGKEAFSMRRAQILRLSSEQWKIPREIAESLGCAVQEVRNVIRAFNSTGLTCLQRKVMGAKNPRRMLDASRREQLQDIAHHSPREYGNHVRNGPLACWPRFPMNKALQKNKSVMRPSDKLFMLWELPGRGPNTGLVAPIRNMY